MPEPNTRWPAYRRVPPFLPVPLRARSDGWTPARQARFIGLLAESGSVAEAARGVGMSRESAWRLRGHAGAESFVHAWDAVLAGWRGEIAPRRKITHDELAERGMEGEFHILMRRGRFMRAMRKPSNRALLRFVRRMDAAARHGARAGDMPPGEIPLFRVSASTSPGSTSAPGSAAGSPCSRPPSPGTS